jgi:hypothetical protein
VPAPRRLIEGIRGRGNIGRWRRAGAAKVVELGRGAQADLKRFGYESDDRDAWLAAARNMQQLGVSDYLNFEAIIRCSSKHPMQEINSN